MDSKRKSWRLWGAAAAWVLATAGGFAVLADYSTRPADTGMVPAKWPDDSRMVRAVDRPTLILFAHPLCPCTRATLGELERLLAAAIRPVAVYVLFVRPAGAPPAWERSDLWGHAARIPGVQTMADNQGSEAARFGALASGQAILYDSGGRLLYHGGMTAARGHSGDNYGRAALAAAINGQSIPSQKAAVYGCALTSRLSATTEGSVP